VTQATQADARAALARTEGITPLAVQQGRLVYRQNEWNQIFDVAKSTPALRQALFALEDSARRVMQAKPSLYTRPKRLSEIDASQLDSQYLKAGANSEAFALAMADCSQSEFLRSSGVELAVVAAYTGSKEYLARCIEILRATCQRTPLQRPGWTLYTPSAVIPPSGDGVWLATAWGIDGIIEILSILGDRVPTELRSSLELQLRTEVAAIVKDWSQQTPWYVRSRAAQSNQWIEPSAALVRACLFLGDPALNDAYELGVRNLTASVQRLGDDGAFLEGVTYASMTSGTLLRVLSDLRLAGDARFDSMGWQQAAWQWWLHMVMPGRQFVNCYDCRMSQVPAWAVENPLPSIVQAVLASADPRALPVVRAMYPGKVDASVTAVRYQMALASADPHTVAVLPYRHFESQQVLCWRSGWEPLPAQQTQMGLWVRGGSMGDSHSHRDQGQVSVYNGDRILLMDCGTPDYSNAALETSYAGVAGHSTIQVNALEPRSRPVDVPIKVSVLNEMGGDVALDLRPAYPGTLLCAREVTWSASGSVSFKDRISVAVPVTAGTVLIRFHTGSVSPLERVTMSDGVQMRWKDASLAIRGGSQIDVTEREWPDAVRPPYVHRVVEIRASVSAQEFEVFTELKFARESVVRD
jgi:hypothetical protein